MICILLASYNGERYIGEQIESLLKQTIQDFVLCIHDDHSSDNTFAIIQDYAARYPSKIIAMQNTVNSGGAKHNFVRMMLEYKEDYVMLCDQDDVWLPEKIEQTFAKMQEMENKYSRETPLLVHTDLMVADENLQIISSSFASTINVNCNRTQLKEQLVQNVLTGCTAMYNRALADLLLNEPDYMMMHDWYLMLIAVAFGKIEFLKERTVLYRQHGSNEIGVKDVRRLKYKLNKLLNYKEIKTAISNTYLQASSFLTCFRDRLTDEQIALLETYCCIPRMHKIARWNTIYRLGVSKNSLDRKIAYFLFV